MKKILHCLMIMCLILNIFPLCVNAEGEIYEISDEFLSDENMMEIITENGYSTVFSTGNYGSEEKEYTYLAANYTASQPFNVVYKLDNIGRFILGTLRYKQIESCDVWFYVSEDNESYDEINIDNITKSITSIGSNYYYITYECINVPANSNYLKIIVNNQDGIARMGAKATKLDYVNIFAKKEIKTESVCFYDSENNLLGDNIKGAKKIKITFNQPMDENKTSDLIISDGNVTETIQGVYGEDKCSIEYEFSMPLEMKTYTFTLEDVVNISGDSLENPYVIKKGYNVVYNLKSEMKIADEEEVDVCIYDVNGEKMNIIPQFAFENGSVLEIEGNKIKALKSGTDKISITFVLGEENVILTKEIKVLNAKDFIVEEKIRLASNEEYSPVFKFVLENDNKIEAQPQQISVSVSDENVLSYSEGKIKALKRGNAVVKVTGDYFGTTFTRYISVGVDKEPKELLKSVDLKGYTNTLDKGMTMQLILEAQYNDNSPADLFAADIKFESSDETVATVSEIGTVTAANNGTAYITCEAIFNGQEIVSENYTINVNETDVSSAEIFLDKAVLYEGETIKPTVKAYGSDGALIENADISLLSTDTNIVSVNDNAFTAKKEGTCQVYAKVTYKGNTVTTKKADIKVVKIAGGYQTDKFDDWSKTYYHDERLYISSASDLGESGNQILTSSTTARNCEVIWKTDLPFDSILLTSYIYVQEYEKKDIEFFVSEDGTEYTSLPISDFNISIGDRVNAVRKIVYSYKGTMPENMHYMKINIDCKQNENTQCVRILSVGLNVLSKPEVKGISFFDKKGLLVESTSEKIDKAVISFAQPIDETSVNESVLVTKASDNSVKNVNVEISDSKTDIILDNTDFGNEAYTITVSGIKNENGDIMESPYTLTTTPEKSVRYSVSESGNTADISVTFEKCETKPLIIAALYNEKGLMKKATAAYAETLESGNIKLDISEKTEKDELRILVWKGIREIQD